jgi:hypothetical protein
VPLALEVDSLLRAEGTYAPGQPGVPWRRLAVLAVLGASLYGAVMGAYGLRPLQALYSSVKVPLLLAVSTCLCLPNFFVVNTLLGLREDLAAAFRAVLTAQGTVSLTLAGLAPLTAVHYVSTESYPVAILANGVAFLVASACGQVTLARHYAPLIERNPRHRLARGAWLVLYVFVAVQMAWILRPFVGEPELATQFFRRGAWGNAYVEVASLVWRTLSR